MADETPEHRARLVAVLTEVRTTCEARNGHSLHDWWFQSTAQEPKIVTHCRRCLAVVEVHFASASILPTSTACNVQCTPSVKIAPWG